MKLKTKWRRFKKKLEQPFTAKERTTVCIHILLLAALLILPFAGDAGRIEISPRPPPEQPEQSLCKENAPCGGGGGGPRNCQDCYPTEWDATKTIQNKHVKEWQEKLQANIRFVTEIREYCKNTDFACYSWKGKIWVDAYKKSNNMPQTFATMHELGHVLWYEKLTFAERIKWAQTYNQTDVITGHATKGPEEDFPENVAAYYHNKENYYRTKQIRPEQLKLLEKILKKYNLTLV